MIPLVLSDLISVAPDIPAGKKKKDEKFTQERISTKGQKVAELPLALITNPDVLSLCGRDAANTAPRLQYTSCASLKRGARRADFKQDLWL